MGVDAEAIGTFGWRLRQVTDNLHNAEFPALVKVLKGYPDADFGERNISPGEFFLVKGSDGGHDLSVGAICFREALRRGAWIGKTMAFLDPLLNATRPGLARNAANAGL
jgi:hypothetical protein